MRRQIAKLSQVEMAPQPDTESNIPLKPKLGWYVLSTREGSHVKFYKYREILDKYKV